MMHHEHVVRRALKLGGSFLISFMCIGLTAGLAVEATAVKSWGEFNKPGPFPQCVDILENVTYVDCVNGLNIFEKSKFKWLSSLLNLVLIIGAGTAYENVALMLTDWENHRTNTEWEDSKVRVRATPSVSACLGLP
jgi:hypothetical protein